MRPASSVRCSLPDIARLDTYFSCADGALLLGGRAIAHPRRGRWQVDDAHALPLRIYCEAHARAPIDDRPVVPDPALQERARAACRWQSTLEPGWRHADAPPAPDGRWTLVSPHDALEVRARPGVDAIEVAGDVWLQVPTCRPHASTGFISFVSPVGAPRGAVDRFYVREDVEGSLGLLRFLTTWTPPSLATVVKLVDHPDGYGRTDGVTIYVSRADAPVMEEIVRASGAGRGDTSLFVRTIAPGVGHAEDVDSHRGRKSFGQVCGEVIAAALVDTCAGLPEGAGIEALAGEFSRAVVEGWRRAGRDPDAVHRELAPAGSQQEAS